MPKDKHKKSKKEQFTNNCEAKSQEGEKENEHEPIGRNLQDQQQKLQKEQIMAMIDRSTAVNAEIPNEKGLTDKQNEDMMSEKLTSILKLGAYDLTKLPLATNFSLPYRHVSRNILHSWVKILVLQVNLMFYYDLESVFLKFHSISPVTNFLI